MIIGALEAGGTKMVCAIGDENGNIMDRISIPTTTPEETIPQIIEYFKDKDIKALGVASFGPLDLNKASETYGYITSTPKLAWANYDLLGNLRKGIDVPMGFDTDVNGSLLGEKTWGIAKDKDTVIYITIGTGVGLGLMAEGKLVHGMLHPEAGHIPLVRHKDDTYEGKCPFHKNCFEGMAAGPAIEARWGKKGIELSENPKVWEIEAYYIAQALYNFALTISPQLIILGGGVIHQKQLLPMIREEFAKCNNAYLQTKELSDLENYIVPASLNDNQGIMGAIRLGLEALGE